MVPEVKDKTLTSNRVVNNDKLILVYLHDVKHVARLYNLKGEPLTPRELPLPLGSIIGSLSGRKEDKEM